MNVMTPKGPDQLAEREFKRLADLIHAACGIKLPPSKKTMLEGRLRRRVRALGQESIASYVSYLFDQEGLEGELDHLIDAVTTNKTDFFREPEHFRFMAQTVLPELAGNDRPLVAWSAAASIGAEAYTMAMVMADFGETRRGFRFQVLATDICSEVLETGKRAVYTEEMIAPVPMEMRKRYLLRSKDRKHPTVRIIPGLRNRVHFTRLNLIDGPFAFELAADIIFCRNILIYFDKPTQQMVLSNLCHHLVPGGFLFIGHSETVAGFDLPLRQVAATIFRRE